MAEQDLLPCPCGAMTLTVMDKMAGAWVECKCGWRGPIRLTKAEAVQAWTSTRATTSDYRRAAAKLEEMRECPNGMCCHCIDLLLEAQELLPAPPVPEVHACGDPDCIVPHPAPHKRPRSRRQE